jgi:hypothetical protein
MEEGRKKVERKTGNGKREKKVGTWSAGGVPTWADIIRGEGVSVNVFIGAGADYTYSSMAGGRKGRRRTLGGSNGGCDHEDWIRLSCVPHRPSRPRSGMN